MPAFYKITFIILPLVLFFNMDCTAAVEDTLAVVEDTLIDTGPKDSLVFRGFDAVNSGGIIHFSWDVLSEIGGDYFLLEKSIDSCKTWKMVGEIESNGDHEDTMYTYEISEISIIQSVRECFRLTRVDNLGVREKLDSVYIYHPALSKLKLIPDAKRANKSLTVTCESLLKIDAFLTIYDWEGEIVYEKSMPLSVGYNRKVVPIKGLTPGSYRVVVRNFNEDAKAKRLVVH